MDAFGVPYTGSNVLGSALSMDKIRTKQVWLSLGLPTPQYRKVTAEDVHANAAELGLPVVVKPANEGSSVGISRVTDDAGLDEAVALAARYDGQLLMEQMVVGDELTVAILGDVALPSIRIVPKGQWYDYNAKYIAEDTQYLCPGLDGDDEEEIRRIALAAFRAAGCRGWGRVDVMRRAGRPGKAAVGGKRAGPQAVAGRAGSDPGRTQAIRTLGHRPPGVRAGQAVPHA
uniref:ATP-grasp domain-containing protein n=1 Tax=Panagrolaimus superbus TaxID=310955 RepID=A0A914Y312_9BILA